MFTDFDAPARPACSCCCRLENRVAAEVKSRSWMLDRNAAMKSYVARGMYSGRNLAPAAGAAAGAGYSLADMQENQ